MCVYSTCLLIHLGHQPAVGVVDALGAAGEDGERSHFIILDNKVTNRITESFQSNGIRGQYRPRFKMKSTK